MSLPELTQSLAACDNRPEEALALARAAAQAVRTCDPDPHSFISLVPPPEITKDLRPGPLLGCIFSVKDNIDIQGVPTTCGSRLFEDSLAYSDARAVQILKDAGAQCIGKNNMHELALGATGINPRFGTTTNPWDESRIAGGSSGGSAVAVALGQVHVALGTDSGGSVRQPAAMCGIVGFKPTGGEISLDGVQGAAWSIDHVGIFASNVGDVAKVWDNLGAERSKARTGPIRIGYLQDDSMGRVDPPVWSAYMATIEELKRSKLDMTGISLPNLTSAPYICVSVVYPEIASQHHDLVRERPEMYSDEIRTIVYLGELWSARNYLDAQRLRVAMEVDFRARTFQYDAVLTPTVAVQPPPIGEPAHVTGDPEGPALYTMMRFTAPFNVIGYPAISIPAGSDHNGLPFGLQVVGKPHRDNDLLDIAHRMEDRLGPMSSRRSQTGTIPRPDAREHGDK